MSAFDEIAKDVCGICCEDMDEGEEGRASDVVKIFCGHKFHGSCICEVFARGIPGCPICRRVHCKRKIVKANAVETREESTGYAAFVDDEFSEEETEEQEQARRQREGRNTTRAHAYLRGMRFPPPGKEARSRELKFLVKDAGNKLFQAREDQMWLGCTRRTCVNGARFVEEKRMKRRIKRKIKEIDTSGVGKRLKQAVKDEKKYTKLYIKYRKEVMRIGGIDEELLQHVYE